MEEVWCHPNALVHAVPEESIRHAINNALVWGEGLTDGQSRVLVLGPDPAGNLLEIVVVPRSDGSLLAIHAMRMRRKYQDLLP